MKMCTLTQLILHVDSFVKYDAFDCCKIRDQLVNNKVYLHFYTTHCFDFGCPIGLYTGFFGKWLLAPYLRATT
jgi:hypothetical protein